MKTVGLVLDEELKKEKQPVRKAKKPTPKKEEADRPDADAE